jgi:tetratricopeptide (TPR) repeat protein
LAVFVLFFTTCESIEIGAEAGLYLMDGPETAEAFLDRGILYGENGDYDLTIADFIEAIRLDPDFA